MRATAICPFLVARQAKLRIALLAIVSDRNTYFIMVVFVSISGERLSFLTHFAKNAAATTLVPALSREVHLQGLPVDAEASVLLTEFARLPPARRLAVPEEPLLLLAMFLRHTRLR